MKTLFSAIAQMIQMIRLRPLKKKCRIGSIIAVIFMFGISSPLAGENQDIFETIRINDAAKVKEMLDKTPLLINSLNRNGLTPLFFAVALKNYEMAKLLIERGSLVRIGDNNLRAPIHFANWNNDKQMIELLLEHGAVIDTRAIGAASPLIHSSLINNFEMSKFLIEKGADIDIQCNSLATPLYFAVFNNNLEYLDYLVEAGADIDIPDFVDRTPLLVAVRDGNKVMAERLLQEGADVFKRDKFLDRSMLHIASIEGHNEVIDLLIRTGLDINEKDDHGFTPLDYAYKYGHPSTVDILLKKGAGTNNHKKVSPESTKKSSGLKTGEATIIKLQNGSWGINTKSIFLILGYSEIGAEPDQKSLLNGYITSEALIQGQKIFCIDHDFHPETSIFTLEGTNPLFSLQKSNENISFVFNYMNDRRYSQYGLKNTYFPKPKDTLNFDGFKVSVLPSYESNLCYIVEVDGLKIIWLTGICDNYLSSKRDNKIIDDLLQKKIEPDILLLGSPTGIGPEIAHGIREAYLESTKLNPQAVFVFGHEPVERKVLYQVKRRIKGVNNLLCSENPGDKFLFRERRIHQENP